MKTGCSAVSCQQESVHVSMFEQIRASVRGIVGSTHGGKCAGDVCGMGSQSRQSACTLHKSIVSAWCGSWVLKCVVCVHELEDMHSTSFCGGTGQLHSYG
jgi:hypothetical protein